MKFDLRQLEMLEAVARHQSLTLAAKALHVTQPAISIQLRKLEDELGIALTERDGRGIRITDAGEEVLRHAQRIGRTIEDLRENIRQHRGLVQGHLRIAVVSTANYLITENIARFRKMYPGIKINLQVANRDGVLELVDRNETDLAVSGQPPDDSDLVARRFRPNPLVVIAPPDHPLAGRTNLTPKDLVAYPFVFREPGSGTREVMLRAFLEHGLECRESCVMSTNEAVKLAVQAGLGIAVISQQTTRLEMETEGLAVLDCNVLSLMRHWFVIYRSFRRLPPPALEFRNQLLGSSTSQSSSTSDAND